MATKAHKLLTGTDLHESKGVATALSGQVYVADGAGSGVWTTINTGVQFSTGDLKFTMKTTADAGWLLPIEGQTIGNDASGATFASTALYSALYQLMWNNITNTYAPVAGGRGGSAAADFAANKKMTFPSWMSRTVGIAGTGTGLTFRGLCSTHGAETTSLVNANLPPYTPTGSGAIVSATVGAGTSAYGWVGTGSFTATVATGNIAVQTSGMSVINGGVVNLTMNAQGGTSQAFSLFQPTVYFYLMVKY